MFSVVIPAHNEENVIKRCLDALFAEGSAEGKEVIVVCNGCSDKTADIARTYNGVQVIELDVASKIAALNAGDCSATLFPRVYLDADITCSIESLEHCIQSMEPKHGIAAPSSKMVMGESSWFVRAYLSTWMTLPYYRSGHMVGSGIYILSAQGRGRFDNWPAIIADDAYVRALFGFDEIYVDRGVSFDIYAPRSLEGLIKIRTRARFGNMEVEARYPTLKVMGENGQGHLLRALVKSPHKILHWLTYVVIQILVLKNCKKKLKAKDFSSWERDESARVSK